MIKRSILVAALLFGSSSAFAGIPVADGVNLAQQMAIQVLEEALARELSKQGIENDEELAAEARRLAEEQFKTRRDDDGYGWKVDVGNSEVYQSGKLSEQNTKSNVYIPSDSTDLDLTLENTYMIKVDDSFREKHGLESDVPHMQESFDKELAYRAMLDEAYVENNERFDLIKALRAMIDAATTPQEKADLDLALKAEIAAIENENLRMQTVIQMKEQEARLERYRLNSEALKALTEDE